MALPSGTKLGPYTVVEPLGAGGMGEVYRARDERLGRDVAVKVLPESVRNDHQRLRRFETEARAAGALSHPNILAVHDFQGEGAVPYLVSELLEGTTLRELLAQRTLSWRTAVELASQIASGLAAAHAKGIVHRDLKPENVFVLRDGRVKILDFGLAKSLAPEGSAASSGSGAKVEATLSSDAHTATGAILGSAGYMAPEQVQGRPADHRADVFAFGAVLYELLSGRRAFAGESPVEKAFAIVRDDPPELPPSVPRALADVVRRCLAKDPSRRFQSADDLVFVLGALTNESDPGLTAVRAGVGAAEGPGARPPPAAAASPGAPSAAAVPGPTVVAPPAPAKPKRASRWAFVLTGLVGIAIGANLSSSEPETASDPARGASRGGDPTRGVNPGEPAVPVPPGPGEKRPDKRRVIIGGREVGEIAPEEAGKVALQVLDREVRKARARVRADRAPPPDEISAAALEIPRWQRLTFRHGLIGNARFTPDAKGVVYTWASDDGRARTELLVPGNPESRPLFEPGLRLMAVSKGGELALGVLGEQVMTAREYFTLGRAPLAGGHPRTVEELVSWADWDPDGDDLALVRGKAPLGRADDVLEHPAGKKVFETPGWLTHVRVSPKGDRVAFLEHPTPGDDLGNVAVLEPDGTVKRLGPTWSSLRGLAWSPSGEELWFTGSTGFDRSLWAVSLDGELRALDQGPADLMLLDVAHDGRALAKSTAHRSQVEVLLPGWGEPRDLGWFDAPFQPIVSEDRQTLVTGEWSEATRGEPVVYVRPLRGGPAVAVGPGFVLDVTRDGGTILALSLKRDRLSLLSAGAGKARTLDTGDLASISTARLRPDGKSCVILARRGTGPLAFFLLDLASGELRALGPKVVERTGGTAIIAPSGRRAIARVPGGPLGVLALDAPSGAEPKAVPGLDDVEEVAGWSSDERAVFVLRHAEPPAVVEKIDLATGKATPVRALLPAAPAARSVRDVHVSGDGRVLAWLAMETDEILWLVEGLE